MFLLTKVCFCNSKVKEGLQHQRCQHFCLSCTVFTAGIFKGTFASWANSKPLKHPLLFAVSSLLQLFSDPQQSARHTSLQLTSSVLGSTKLQADQRLLDNRVVQGREEQKAKSPQNCLCQCKTLCLVMIFNLSSYCKSISVHR